MPAIVTHPKPSDLTVTDVFCGAGGNTIGAKKAGLRVRVGLNHWERAIETYGTNNPDVDVVERVDVSLCDPRRYPRTDIGIFSPECTTHSPAGGNKHRPKDDLGPLFGQGKLDEATVRSRVTMFDVVRFTEFHRYRIIVVENVFEATKWELFPDWLHMMDHLGYQHRILSLNSMFFHPTPQSRDRIYVVFWQKGNRAPDLEYRPPAPCAKCGVVESVQVWKQGRAVGKYRRQYQYACPRCAAEVTPFYYAALNAIDFSIPATRIGDRKTPLKPRTMERVRFGLDKFGRRVLVVQTNMTSGVGCRVRNGADDPMPAQTASPHHAVVSPFLVETAQTHSKKRRARDVSEPMPTFGAQLSQAVVQPGAIVPLQGVTRALGLDDALPAQLASCSHEALVTPSSSLVDPCFPFFVGLSHGRGKGQLAGATDPMPAQTTAQDVALVVPLRTNGKAVPLDQPLHTVCAGAQHQMLVQGAQLSMRDADAMRVAGLEREFATQGCAPQQALISPTPSLLSYYGTDQATPVDEPVPALTTRDRHGLMTPGDELRVEDCFFRMLDPHEIGAAMAFPADYEVKGTKRDRVKLYGNAVTPPVMDWIVRQCAASLAPELEGAA